jgi:hypothetical protein
MPPSANQVELATSMRMKGVRDADLEAGRIHTTCRSATVSKVKGEAAVGIVSRFVLGKLRKRRFFSLVG